METILITGGTGFLGRNLGKNLANNYRVILTGRNGEQNEKVRSLLKCEVAPMDITNIESIRDIMTIFKPTTIIHAAATKYVHISEKYPNECLDINIKGAQNIARVAMEQNVKAVIGISTDKASSCKSFYGVSKKAMENLFLLLDKSSYTRFICVRLGNLPWSTGSVLPIWQNMLIDKGMIETTGFNMFRFFIKLPEAIEMVKMVIENIDLLGGKIICPDLKVASIQNLLEVFIEKYKGDFIRIGARPGESVDETMINNFEAPYTCRTKINNNWFFLIEKEINKKLPKMTRIDTNNQLVMRKEDLSDIIEYNEDWFI